MPPPGCWENSGYQHLHVRSRLALNCVKFSVLFCEVRPIHWPRASFLPFHHRFNCLPDMTFVSLPLNFPLLFIAGWPAVEFFSSSGIASSSAIAGVFGRGEYLNANTASYSAASSNESVSSKSCSVSPGKPTIDVGRDRDFAPRRFHPCDALEILFAGVQALHCVKHASRSALHRKMDVIAQRRGCINRVYNIAAQNPWMRSCEPHAVDPGNSPMAVKQFRKRFLAVRIQIRIHVLSEQLDIRVSQIDHLSRFREHRG